MCCKNSQELLAGDIDKRRKALELKLLTYLLPPWSRVLEKLTGSQLVKKFPTFYGTRGFITAFTSALLSD